MGDSLGRQLFDLLRTTVIDALDEAVSSAAADLTRLTVDPDFDVSPFAGRVLTAPALDHPVLSALSGISAAEPPARVGLHGWRSTTTDDAPRGIALVVTSGTGAVAVVAFVPAEGRQLSVLGSGLGGGQLPPLTSGSGVTLRVGGVTPDEVQLALPLDGPPAAQRLAAGTRLEVALTRPAGAALGPEGGPFVQLGSLALTAALASTDGATITRELRATLSGGEVVLVPGFLKGLVPVDLTFPVDLDLELTAADGIALHGSPSLSTRLSGSDGRALQLAAGVAGTETPRLDLSFATSLRASLPGVPIEVDLDGLGVRLPLQLRLGTPVLPDPRDVLPEVPDGVSVTLDLPAVSGSGTLAKVGDDLVGALAVRIPPMSASAFGVLAPARAGAPLSFLVILGATFPPPGVQVGFGFAITGVGGVIGVNRRVDRDALVSAVTDGSAAQLLFPADPTGAGASTLGSLPAIFPAARGSVVVGPMFQIGWGGRLVSLSVAVLLESSRQVRLTILGKLVVALPDPAAPLVLLQATFAGLIEPAEPSVTFVASLTGSHLVGCPLTGDLLLLVRGGSEPVFILSAGGFHPAFPVPRGVPPLQRMGMDLCPVPWLGMRCENYFALTSNTLQLGARLEIAAEVAECGLRGFLAFDALAQFEPFRFLADMSGAISLRVFGETLMGISLALHLEGPAPYLARGRGSIDLFFFEVSFDFEIGWGSPAPALTEPDVGRDLRAALGRPEAWRSRGTSPPGLTLTAAALHALEKATVLDPYGAVSVRQEVLPLGIEIVRYAGAPCPPQRWDLVAGELGPGEPAHQVQEIRTEFAPALFVPTATDDAALGGEPFLSLRSGMELSPAPAAGAEQRPADLQWEERVISHDLPSPLTWSLGLLTEVAMAERVLTATSFTDPDWWPSGQEVVVDPLPLAGVASSWSMTPGDATAGSLFEVAQTVLAGDDVQMAVETWEL
ncbi:DUF6603 domain-containing protein [Nocardioides sp. 503]|uniref:DUF6603 domain-containing protein n=1 Tax=Nocardioides sp. 503 TaxID=2508326 RepID=UPI00106F969B|nr:DUF6603 domain-containing protein [Nocardioides sp. 503]